MILGLGHITIATDKKSTVQAYIEAGYTLKTAHQDLPNDIQKQAFLSEKIDRHDLYILEKKDSARVEVIVYETVKEKSLASYKKQQIIIPTSALQGDKDLLEKIISSTFEDNRISIKTPIKSLQAEIELTEVLASDHKIYLNSDGAVCIAFIVKNLKSIRDSLTGEPIAITDIFTISVSGQKLNVVLLKTYGGFFIELYELSK